MGKESACNAGGAGSIPGRSPRGGHGNSLQYSCLENPMDRGAWQVIVQRVAKNQTPLKQLSMPVPVIIHILYMYKYYMNII